MSDGETHGDWRRAHAELVRIGKSKCALDWEEGRWLLVALRTGAHRRLGMGSFAEYVERLLGHGPRTTEEKLRVATALERLPHTDAALRDGALHWSAVREITRVAVPQTEAEWIAAAANKTVRQVESMVSGRKPGDRPSDPADAQARKHVLRFEVSAETLATFREAMAALRREAGEPLDDDATLLALSRRILVGSRDDGRANYQIAMTVCDRCRAGVQHGKGEAIPVAPEIVEMAECDAQHLEAEGRRATQKIPRALRRQVMRRYSGACAVPGCKAAVFVDVHHLDPLADGGAHDPERMIALCGAHHRAVHSGKLVVTGTALAGFAFAHADGSPYGRMEAPEHAANCATVFQALRDLGFKEVSCRRAVDAVRAHVGGEASAATMTRAAIEWLTQSGSSEAA